MLFIRIFAGLVAVIFVLGTIVGSVGELMNIQRRKKILEKGSEKLSMFTFRLIAGSLLALFFATVLMFYAIQGHL